MSEEMVDSRHCPIRQRHFDKRIGRGWRDIGNPYEEWDWDDGDLDDVWDEDDNDDDNGERSYIVEYDGTNTRVVVVVD